MFYDVTKILAAYSGSKRRASSPTMLNVGRVELKKKDLGDFVPKMMHDIHA